MILVKSGGYLESESLFKTFTPAVENISFEIDSCFQIYQQNCKAFSIFTLIYTFVKHNR